MTPQVLLLLLLTEYLDAAYSHGLPSASKASQVDSGGDVLELSRRSEVPLTAAVLVRREEDFLEDKLIGNSKPNPALALPKLTGDGELKFPASNDTQWLTIADNNTAETQKLLDKFRQSTAVARKGVGLAFLGGTMFMLVLMYMAKQTFSEDLKESSLNLTAGIVSLFLAVTIFMIFKKALKLANVEQKASECVELLVFILLLFLSPLAARGMKADSKILAAFKILGSHLIGFAGADALAVQLRKSPWNKSPSSFAGGCFGCTLTILFLMWLSSLCSRPRENRGQRVSKRTLYDPGVLNEQLEACGFMVGFLGSMWVRFTIMDSLPGDAAGRNVTENDVKLLFGSCLVCAVIYALLCVWIRPMMVNDEDDEHWSQLTRLVSKFVVESWAMFLAWNTFYAVQWDTWRYHYDQSYAQSVVVRLVACEDTAFALSCTNVVVLLVTVAICHGHGLQRASRLTELTNGMVLLTGYPWEICFYMIMNDSSILLYPTDIKKQRVSDLMNLAVFALLLLIAFIWIIVPACAYENMEDALEKEVKAEAKKQRKGGGTAIKKDESAEKGETATKQDEPAATG
eukprot:CAMPEP_0197626548 /NCGR_PEP_ID=MMETSP1338-20131121/5463_1 /TAXON_ID=43686 ORGANISM="Pelagodinium beii, Strain RCC1491" /NCGR_SAMPLE_ID=MMETSP1338 /ASSEMBLY_ACC=CAM_ASM_000754 /LENGTH=571 /DNA_ID=CAMNT_0043197091 /DNA_START=130 /DNA_END=1845 /DNA_ORIENTATION=-